MPQVGLAPGATVAPAGPAQGAGAAGAPPVAAQAGAPPGGAAAGAPGLVPQGPPAAVQPDDETKLQDAKNEICNLYQQNVRLNSQVRDAADWDELKAASVTGQSREELCHLVDLLNIDLNVIPAVERRRLSKTKLVDAIGKARWDINSDAN